MTRVRARARTVVPLLFVALLASVLASCSHESVSPAEAPVAYVAIGAGIANPGNTVAVVDTSTGEQGKAITTGTLPAAVALLPGAGDLLVAEKAEDELVEVSTVTGKVVRSVGVGLEPDAVAVTPDGELALVANFGGNTVSAVRLDRFVVGATVPVGRQPTAVAVTPDGSRALVTDYQDGTVTPIALPSLAPGPPVAVGPEPTSVFVDSSGTTALVAGFQTSSLTPVALPTLTPGQPVPMGVNPTGIASPVHAQVAWVSGGDGITPVVIASGSVGTSISIGAPAACLAFAPNGDAWVCSGNNALVEVDPTSNRVVRTVRLGGLPAAVVISGALPS